jgi:beta-lactamase superfamily II metal-dependent hydrolase
MKKKKSQTSITITCLKWSQRLAKTHILRHIPYLSNSWVYCESNYLSFVQLPMGTICLVIRSLRDAKTRGEIENDRRIGFNFNLILGLIVSIFIGSIRAVLKYIQDKRIIETSIAFGMKHFLLILKHSVLIYFILLAQNIYAQNDPSVFPAWEVGQMEIHHINTGRGVSVFCIFPDGTNMLIDAGDLGTQVDPVYFATLPNETKQPGEWIGRYIARLITYRSEKKIDYALLTHFHGDHMGKVSPGSPKTQKGGDYYLSGLSEVAEWVPFKTMIDRDWPTYQYPSPLKGRPDFDNYKEFVDWSLKNSSMTAERFHPGSNAQISLIYQPEQYPGFEVRNIYANGALWKGKKDKTKSLFPKGAKVDENKLSASVRISYGNFDYFTGGDIMGRISINTPKWNDLETPIGKVLGPIEVCEANHHAFVDAMNESFIASTQPQVFVIQAWNARHTNLTTLRAMSSTELYPEKRTVLSTNIHGFSENYIGKYMNQISGYGGHIVIKVQPGGDTYKVYLLSAEDESMTIKSVFGPFTCR